MLWRVEEVARMSELTLTRMHDPQTFYDRALPFLARAEAEHNLIIGLTQRLIENPDYYDEPAYMALITAGDEIVAVALRTPPHNLILSNCEHSGVVPVVAADVRSLYGTIPGLVAEATLARTFASHWQDLTGSPCRLGLHERIYQLEQVTPPAAVPGSLRLARPEDRALLIGWVHDFQVEALGEEPDPEQMEKLVDDALRATVLRRFFVWDVEGTAVTLAGTNRPTPSGMTIGPVYTPPDLRRKGYATACTAAVSQQMLDEGRRYCFLYTDLGNPTSNSIYMKIGYKPICDVDLYRFDEA
jgi:hypothetical protein